MHNDEKTLESGSKAFKLVEELKKEATSCLRNNLQEKEEAITLLKGLERLFKPYHDELQRIQEEKKEKELKIKRICAEQGHTGEWKEETYYTEGWMGDLSDRQWVRQPHVRWARTCTRCGERELSETEPVEVRKLRNKKEVEALKKRIKKLEAEL